VSETVGRQSLTAPRRSSNLPAVSLIRSLFWFLLFVFFTFSFVVLFEYGPSDFVSGFKKEFQRVETFVQQKIHPGAKQPEKP
jgi:hypothetical protein